MAQRPRNSGGGPRNRPPRGQRDGRPLQHHETDDEDIDAVGEEVVLMSSPTLSLDADTKAKLKDIVRSFELARLDFVTAEVPAGANKKELLEQARAKYVTAWKALLLAVVELHKDKEVMAIKDISQALYGAFVTEEERLLRGINRGLKLREAILEDVALKGKFGMLAGAEEEMLPEPPAHIPPPEDISEPEPPPLPVPTQREQRTGLPPVPAGLEKDATVKAEMDVAKEMYLTQLESGEKWGETHNVLRKKYTETLGTYIETQRLLAETEARIRFGNRERERGVDEKSVVQHTERFDEFLENDTEYKGKIEELTRLLERTEVDFRDKDSSFDPAAALLGDSKLMMSFESYLEATNGPAKAVFEGMQKPVLSYEEEQMVGEELVLKFYIARTEYFTAYHAYQMGHASRDFFRRQAIVYKRLREDVTNELMRQGRATDIYQEDPQMENLIKQYWLSGFKKGRVRKTAERVGQQRKGGFGRAVAAVLAFFAAWSHDPNAPQEPSVRYEDTRGQVPEPRRTPQRAEASQETSATRVFETPFVQEVPEGRGAISTFRMLLSRMTPQMREAIYQGIEKNKNAGMTEEDYRLLRSVRENPDRYADGAQLLARQLGFAKADATTEPQIPRGAQFVFDQSGFYIEHEGSRTQLLNAQFEVVATYGSE